MLSHPTPTHPPTPSVPGQPKLTPCSDPTGHAKYQRDGRCAICACVATAPPMTQAQIDVIAALLGFRSGNRTQTPYVAPQSPTPKPEPKVALYRHFDADEVLLYVGITNDLPARTRNHTKSSHWAEFAVRSEAEWFDTREAAAQAERQAIATEGPLFNAVHATRAAKLACVNYLIMRGRVDLLELAR